MILTHSLSINHRPKGVLHGLFLCFLLAAIGLFPDHGRAQVFNPAHFELENGLTVIVIEDHRAPVVNHMLWYRVGSADEPPGKSGVAHFLEHLMFKGTKDAPEGLFSDTIAKLGGQENAFTSYDFTGYYQRVAKEHLGLMMKFEADRMANLAFDDDDVRTEREVVLEERAQRISSNPAAQLSEMRSATQFLSHPYGIPVIGWEHEIKALTAEDLYDFYETYYAPNNAVLIVAGDVTPDAVRQLAEEHYGPVARSDLPPRLRPQEPPQIAARRISYSDQRVRQESLTRSYLAPSRSAGDKQHAVPLRLFSHIAGSGATSRLYRRLVKERKLAVSAGTAYSSVSLDPSTFYVYATPAADVSLAALEEALDEELQDLVENGVSEDEMRRAKTLLLADTVYARDSLSSGPQIFGRAMTTGISIEEIEAWPDKVRAVTREQVRLAAKAVLDKRKSVTSWLELDKDQ